jgi:hypothetical protein
LEEIELVNFSLPPRVLIEQEIRGFLESCRASFIPILIVAFFQFVTTDSISTWRTFVLPFLFWVPNLLDLLAAADAHK